MRSDESQSRVSETLRVAREVGRERGAQRHRAAGNGMGNRELKGRENRRSKGARVVKGKGTTSECVGRSD
jgi:hypothetical protein